MPSPRGQTLSTGRRRITALQGHVHRGKISMPQGRVHRGKISMPLPQIDPRKHRHPTSHRMRSGPRSSPSSRNGAHYRPSGLTAPCVRASWTSAPPPCARAANLVARYSEPRVARTRQLRCLSCPPSRVAVAKGLSGPSFVASAVPASLGSGTEDQMRCVARGAAGVAPLTSHRGGPPSRRTRLQRRLDAAHGGHVDERSPFGSELQVPV